MCVHLVRLFKDGWEKLISIFLYYDNVVLHKFIVVSERLCTSRRKDCIRPSACEIDLCFKTEMSRRMIVCFCNSGLLSQIKCKNVPKFFKIIKLQWNIFCLLFNLRVYRDFLYWSHKRQIFQVSAKSWNRMLKTLSGSFKSKRPNI